LQTAGSLGGEGDRGTMLRMRIPQTGGEKAEPLLVNELSYLQLVWIILPGRWGGGGGWGRLVCRKQKNWFYELYVVGD
jgi:hypothetical protein